ncbi:MAG: hypothetical protein HUU34_08710, partial [Saprospiraceae bacterium]|nr:hypothetical protein [Saprospiraceae bacterium]
LRNDYGAAAAISGYQFGVAVPYASGIDHSFGATSGLFDSIGTNAAASEGAAVTQDGKISVLAS